MSNPLSENSPRDPYAAPSYVPPDPTTGRPIGVTVFAIFCFVFAALGLLGLLSSAAMLFSGADMNANNPVMELCRTNSFYMVFTIATTILGVIFMVVQAIAGFKLLQMSPTGRKLILIYAIYAMIAGVVTNIVNFLYLMPAMREQMAEQAKGAPPQAQAIMEVSMMIGMIGGIALAFLFPIAILWYFNRAGIKARFAANET